MQVDKTPFPVHTLELNNSKILLGPEQAEGANGKNVVIGDPRPMNVNDKILAREVVSQKTPDGKITLKIILNAPKPGGQGDSTSQPAVQARPVRPVQPVRLDPSNRSDQSRVQPRTFKLKRSEVGTWKMNKPKVQGRSAN